jgi:drug/metabolite transporter (DMT)-like permease
VTNGSRQVWASLSLLVVAVIWGATFVMVKGAVALVDPLFFLALRFSLAFLVLVVVFWKELRQVNSGHLLPGIAIGVFLFGGYVFQTVGLQYTTASKAGFITGLYVVMVPVFSAFFLRKVPGKIVLLGVALATVGLGCLSQRADGSLAAGDAIVLGSAVSFALHIVAVGKYAPDVDPRALTTVQIGTAALLSWLGAGIVGGIRLPLPWSIWGAAAFTGVLATALAFGVQCVAQRFVSPTRTALIFTGEPVFAGIFGILLAGEVLGPRGILGCALILAGILMPSLRSRLPQPGRSSHP